MIVIDRVSAEHLLVLDGAMRGREEELVIYLCVETSYCGLFYG